MCVVWFVVWCLLCMCVVYVRGVWDGRGQGSLQSGRVRSLLNALGLAGAPRREEGQSPI